MSARYRVAVGSAHRSEGGGRIEVLEVTSLGAGPATVRVADSVPTGPIAYLARHPSLPLLYAASEEGSDGVVTAYEIAVDGMRQRGRARWPGRAAHLCVSSNGRHLLTADYGTSSVTAFRLDDDGAITERTDGLSFEGSGPSPRQERSHPHQVIEAGDAYLVPDLGADLVRRVAIGADGSLRETDRHPLPAGSGPRHAVVVGDLLYVACELSGEVRWDTVSRPNGFAGVIRSSDSGLDEVMPSAIRVRGDGILVANRGPGTILEASLTPDGVAGCREFDTAGTWPRDIVVAGDELVIADNRADSVDVVALSGVHAVLARHPISGPSCVLLLESEGAPG